ncbi:hypothetical protein HNP84_010141 [Thermocatellispora tengchongensis]|uniref:DUF998 domain-containing protein n=1 Tax=Thermocatellispora tengchongensis TaxID=1073253 RepID=A0A840PG36_9ACTN|nr:hypothetical protein [Thermocatellispora tengchongensis]MBB5140374.1 hypothetical protein [Thermocatellispora tengchongensis]
MTAWLVRFGAVCGFVLGLCIGVPGVVEAFTGETTATSLVIGIGGTLGAPVVTALYLAQGGGRGFHTLAFAVNMIGLSLFGGVGFMLNVALFHLDPAVAAEVLAGPARIAVYGGMGVFVAGTILFCVSMARARVLPAVPVLGYGVALVLLAALAPLPDTPLTSLVHLLVCVSLVWLSAAALRGPAAAPAVRPATAAAGDAR